MKQYAPVWDFLFGFRLIGVKTPIMNKRSYFGPHRYWIGIFLINRSAPPSDADFSCGMTFGQYAHFTGGFFRWGSEFRGLKMNKIRIGYIRQVFSEGH